MADVVGPEALGKRMFAGWDRQQVDFGSETNQNRYGCRAGIYAERIPKIIFYSLR